jgi:hypothetical protein
MVCEKITTKRWGADKIHRWPRGLLPDKSASVWEGCVAITLRKPLLDDMRRWR